MQDYTITDVMNEWFFIYFGYNAPYIKTASKEWTWKKIREQIIYDINDSKKINDFEMVNRLERLLIKCPFRKNY